MTIATFNTTPVVLAAVAGCDVTEGDRIAFGPSIDTFARINDVDTVTAIDTTDGGRIHFAGGTYLLVDETPECYVVRSEVIPRHDDVPAWVPVLLRRDGGAIWCSECDAPYVSCGSSVHNPNHPAPITVEVR